MICIVRGKKTTLNFNSKFKTHKKYNKKKYKTIMKTSKS